MNNLKEALNATFGCNYWCCDRKPVPASVDFESCDGIMPLKEGLDYLDLTFGEVEDAYNAARSEELDNVNHPSHYISKGGIETIDVIDAWTEGLDGIVAVDAANVIKYISRWNKKNGIEDLKKARWYLNHLIVFMEKNDG